MTTLTVPAMFDAHVHLREGDALRHTVPATAAHCDRALIMPNLKEAITTPERLVEYRRAILLERDRMPYGSNHNFTPMMTFEIREDTPPELIHEFVDAGAVAGKVYPYRLTTNAEHGVQDYTKIYPVLAEMQKHELVLCLHGEQPGLPLDGMQWFRAESIFLERTLLPIRQTFPDLRITLEHISTADAALFVAGFDNIAASITVHHLLLNHDDVGGYQLNPGNYCKPVAKMEGDRTRLLAMAMSDNAKFFFGSDSAPHLPEVKARMMNCCAGCYTAPFALPMLAALFAEHRSLQRLAEFTSQRACTWYRRDFTRRMLTVGAREMTIPETVGPYVPFMAGQLCSWSVV